MIITYNERGGYVMSLVKCPECKREVSNTAKRCVHCGYKMNTIKDSLYSKVFSAFLIFLGLAITVASIFNVNLLYNLPQALVGICSFLSGFLTWLGIKERNTKKIKIGVLLCAPLLVFSYWNLSEKPVFLLFLIAIFVHILVFYRKKN